MVEEVLVPRSLETITKPQEKVWRLYYNRGGDYPFLTAVDNGTISTQIRVQWVTLYDIRHQYGATDKGPKRDGVCAAMTAHMRDRRKGVQNEPTWWLEFIGTAVFEAGGVAFYGNKSS